jgi:4-hydroxybenzoyl-CoA reductase subunit beta
MLTLPRFAFIKPRSLDEALVHLGEHAGESLIVAGGTDAVPNLKHRLHEPGYVVHIGGLGELHHIRHEADGLRLGALVTLSELAGEPRIRREFPSLAKAAGLVAGPQLRNMGTLGGNLCLDTRCTYYNQTFFWREALGFCLKKSGTLCHVVPAGKRCVAAHSSDVAPVLIALEAEVEIATPAKTPGVPGTRRRISVDEFFVADGIHNNVLVPGEIVTGVFIPARSRGLAAGYQKLRPRAAIDFPMLSVAFAARLAGGRAESARLVVSAIAARPRVITGVEAIVGGRPLDDGAADALAETAHRQCHPLINVAYDADYGREMVPVYVRRAVREARGEA